MVNSASPLVQYRQLLFASVGLVLHSLYRESDRKVLEMNFMTEFEKLFPYDAMAKKFPDFAKEVKESDWNKVVLLHLIPFR
jgi:hypothetical protein